MTQPLLETTLTDGTDVFCLRRSEPKLVDDQVKEYFRHGISVNSGDTVFDVGANIGMFSLEVNKRCSGAADVFAFEPIPDTFSALEANVQRHCSERVRVFNCGLAAISGEVEFGFYPYYTMLSSAYHDKAEETEVREQIKHSILRNLDHAPRPISWLRWLPQHLRQRTLDWLTRRSFGEMQKIRCQQRTLSEIVSEFDVTQIDLLKVDVEKGELDVLRGIADQHWPMIRQIVMEVHDLDDRVTQIQSLLKQQQFDHIVVEQEAMLRGSNVYSLYGRRSNRNSGWNDSH